MEKTALIVSIIGIGFSLIGIAFSLYSFFI
jgi:hypothetical protein